MTGEREALAGRLRAALADEPSTVEKPMFGTRAFLVRDRIVACAQKEGDLLVRIPAERHGSLLTYPGAIQAEMGAGRSMGPGWISVAADALDGDGLALWLEVALEHNRRSSEPASSV